MNNYQLEWNRGVGPTWHHDFCMASDAMALEYVRRILQNESGMQQATRIQLWNMDTQESVLYGTPQVSVTIGE